MSTDRFSCIITTHADLVNPAGEPSLGESHPNCHPRAVVVGVKTPTVRSCERCPRPSHPHGFFSARKRRAQRRPRTPAG